MIDKADFECRIAIALAHGRRKIRLPLTEEEARIRAMQVSSSLSGLFSESPLVVVGNFQR